MSYLKKINNVNRYVLLAGILVALAGCSGGDEVEGGTPGTGVTGGIGGDIGNSSSNPPTSIAITYPITNAIENLGGGVYRRQGSVIVSDSEGNSVVDGTRINLFLIDSIIAKGTITPGTDSIAGTVLTDTAPLLADNTATTLDSAYVYRNAAFRFIQPNDHLLLISSDEVDKVRIVASTPTNTTVGVTSSYVNPYPNVVYDGITNVTEYRIGATTLAATIEGEGGTVGYTTTTDGVGTFYITYPANVNYMRVGCAPTVDTRYTPQGSADLFLLASASTDINVTAVDNSFCFASIAGGSIEMIPNAIASTTTVTGQVRDGGDTVPVPFTGVGYSIESSGANVTVSNITLTDAGGYFSADITVTGNPGDSADVTFTANDGAEGTVSVSIPN